MWGAMWGHVCILGKGPYVGGGDGGGVGGVEANRVWLSKIKYCQLRPYLAVSTVSRPINSSESAKSLTE